MGAGCNASRVDAEVVEVGRRFHSLMVRGKKELRRAGWLANSWRSLLAPLVLGSEGWKNLVGGWSTSPFWILNSIPRLLWCLRRSRLELLEESGDGAW